MKMVNQWIKFCAARDANPMLFKQIIECPNHSDILLGRGQIVMNHPGNSMFRDFIQNNLEVYSNIQSKKESTQWTWSVVRKLKSEYGARFLKEERIYNGLTAWVEVTNEISRNKVRIAFRDARTRQTKLTEKGKQPLVEPRMSTSKRNGPSKDGSSSVPPTTSFLAKRKNGVAPVSDDFFPLETTSQDLPDNSRFGLSFEEFNVGLSALNNNISQLNNNLNEILQRQQVANSSTSQFLDLDGSNSSKRQRLDTDNGCFDCL